MKYVFVLIAVIVVTFLFMKWEARRNCIAEQQLLHDDRKEQIRKDYIEGKFDNEGMRKKNEENSLQLLKDLKQCYSYKINETV